MMKRIFAAALAAMLCMSLAACGGTKDDSSMASMGAAESKGAAPENEEKEEEAQKPDREVKHYLIQEDGSAPLTEMSEIADPQSIFDSITYDEKMLYGQYTMGREIDIFLEADEAAAFIEEMDFEMNDIEGVEKSLTKLPFAFLAGPQNQDNILSTIKEHEWMTVYFCDEIGYAQGKVAAYTVSGNTLSLRYLETYSYDAETDHMSYTLSEEPVEFEFSFDGVYLTLSRDGKSVTIHPVDFGETEHRLVQHCYPEKNSPVLDNISTISLHKILTENEDSVSTYIEKEGTFHYGAAMELRDDGVLTMSWDDENGSGACQLAYFYCGYDGLILTDGTEIYYYTADEHDFVAPDLSASLSAQDALSLKDQDVDAITALEEKRKSLFEALAAAFKEEGLNVKVDPERGEIALDAAVLFGVDQSDVSAEGKSFLSRFLAVYTSVVFSEEYDGFVSQIVVEGHTDSSGTYAHNQVLSQERAENVMNYCNSTETGLPAESTSSLQQLLSATGYSCDQLIYDENGNEDADASRRVSFRFIISLY